MCNCCVITSDQCLCFAKSTIIFLVIDEISSHSPYSVAMQLSLCCVRLETQKLGFVVTWLKLIFYEQVFIPWPLIGKYV